MQRRVRIMVTGVGGGGIGAQILKALRMSAHDYELFGGDVTPVSKGLMEVDRPFLLPRGTDPQYLGRVLDICTSEKVDVLFPGSEPELLAMSRGREAIEAAGIFLPIQPAEVIETCRDKAATMAILADRGFCVPRTVTVAEENDLERVGFFPAVLKPSTGGGGSAGVMIAQSAGESAAIGRMMLVEYGEFIAQEYVGTVDSEFTVGVLTSMDGELINSVAMRRNIASGLGNRLRVANRSGREELGPILAISSGISQGELGRFEEVTAPSEEIALALGSAGAINIQGRLVNGNWHVFEINPRISGTTSMRAMMGYNEPDLLIRKHVLGEAIAPRFEYRSGHLVRGLQEVLIDFEVTNPNAATS